MGHRRGQRTRAKDKVWPGADAVQVRAEKHGGIPSSDDIEVMEESEYQGSELPHLQPVTAGIVRLPPKMSLVIAPSVDATTKPELTLDNAYANRHALPQINKSRKRRAVDKRTGRGLVSPRSDIAKIRTSTWIGADARPSPQALGQMRTVSLKKRIRELILEMSSKNKMDAFVKICRLGTRIEYALPELFYKGDPCRAMLFVESLDLTKFATAIGESYEQANQRSQTKRTNRNAELGKKAASAIFV